MSGDVSKLKSLVSRLQQKKSSSSSSDGIQRSKSGSFDMTSISRVASYDDLNGDIISLASLSMKKKKKKVILSLSSLPSSSSSSSSSSSYHYQGTC